MRIEPQTHRTPAAVITTRPPPIATIALPEIASPERDRDARPFQRVTPKATSATAITAGYA